MSFNELAKTRKSVRKFKPDDVSDDIIMKLLEAAQEAPSGGNCQPWHFYVIKDKKVISEIHAKAYTSDWILTAPVFIVVCADIQKSESRYGERGRNLYCIQDTAAAIQNILLCAADLGLGSCWCGAFNESAVSEILNLPKDMRPVAIIPLGYAAADNPKPKRRPINEIVTFICPEEPANIISKEGQDSKISFEHCNMNGALFNDVNLKESRFENANMKYAVFSNINMKNASFSDINMSEATFGGLNLNNSKFGCVEMKNVQFVNPDLSNSRFENCNFSNVSIEKCNLSNMEIKDSDITGLKINGIEVDKLLKK